MAHWNAHWNSSKVNLDIMKVWAQKFIVEYEMLFQFAPTDIVLDFGAGRGDVSLHIAPKAAKVYVYDKSTTFQETLKNRFSSAPTVGVIADIGSISDSVSVIIVNSVIQYMSIGEISAMFTEFKKISDSHTRIIIADILPPGYSKVRDALHLIASGISHGYLREFLTNMITCMIFRPGVSFSSSSLQTHSFKTLLDIAERHGYSMRMLPRNFTYSKHRYTIVCTTRLP